MKIRLADEKDLVKISEIYDIARDFMQKSGNPSQWVNGYPSKGVVLNDISNKNLYVMEEDVIVGVFAFIIGKDKTYDVIEQGEWFSDEPYGTIHRIASNGKRKGIFSAIVSFCEKRMWHLRIDTHRDNKIMQHLIDKHGFRKCGIIYTATNSPRIAFEKI